MKLKSTLIVLSLIAAPAFASDQVVSKTREQVRAELAQAQQSGDMLAFGESGLRSSRSILAPIPWLLRLRSANPESKCGTSWSRLSVQATSWWPVNSASNAMN